LSLPSAVTDKRPNAFSDEQVTSADAADAKTVVSVGTSDAAA
jgi:hypothetical protein